MLDGTCCGCCGRIGINMVITNEVLPFPKGTRVVQLYISKSKGLRAMPGVITEAGPEVSEVKFDTGMIRFVPHNHLRKERPHVRTKEWLEANKLKNVRERARQRLGTVK
jgi:hypothetical protein